MITTDFATGSPCMLDLGVPDVRAAAAFYGAVLGWDYEPMGDGEDMEGGMFNKDGKMVGGLGKLTEEGARPAWMISPASCRPRRCAARPPHRMPTWSIVTSPGRPLMRR